MSNMKQSNRCVMLRSSKQETDEAKLAQHHTFYSVYLQMKHHFQPPIKHYILVSSFICKGLEWSWLTERSSRPPPGQSLKSVMTHAPMLSSSRFWWEPQVPVLASNSSNSKNFWVSFYPKLHTSIACTFLVQVIPASHTHFSFLHFFGSSSSCIAHTLLEFRDSAGTSVLQPFQSRHLTKQDNLT